MSLRTKLVALLLVLLVITLKSYSQDRSDISYLALGDSYTIGESVSESERWPVLLADSLRENGIKVKDPKIIAKTGWTTDELLETIDKENPTTNYDLVSLLIGVNNQYRGYNIDTYRKEFRELLEQAVTFAEGNSQQVFVVSIPDYGVTPFGQKKNPPKIARELEQYNTIARKICHSEGISFVNITPYSKKAATQSNLIADDDLHPSGKMYQKWVSLIIPEILPKLKK